MGVNCYDAVMERHFRYFKVLGLTQAATKEQFYGFACDDVVCAHFHKLGHKTCVYFRLLDGRVIDTAGREHDPDPALYDITIH